MSCRNAAKVVFDEIQTDGSSVNNIIKKNLNNGEKFNFFTIKPGDVSVKVQKAFNTMVSTDCERFRYELESYLDSSSKYLRFNRIVETVPKPFFGKTRYETVPGLNVEYDATGKFYRNDW